MKALTQDAGDKKSRKSKKCRGSQDADEGKPRGQLCWWPGQQSSLRPNKALGEQFTGAETARVTPVCEITESRIRHGQALRPDGLIFTEN